VEKILKRKKLNVPLATDFSNARNTTINENLLLEDLNFYHAERLNAIYAERAHFNFTSIQSIADEINSLKLLNPGKAEGLLIKYKSVLIKNEYETSSIFYKSMASLINDKGELILEGKNIATNYLKKEQVIDVSARRIVKQGFVASGYSGFILIGYTAEVDVYINVDDPTDRFFIPTNALGCFVNSPNGYVAYPCYFFVNNLSKADFSLGCSGFQSLPYISGIGSAVINTGIVTFYNYSCVFENYSGNISGNFAVPAGSSFLWVSGSVIF
jgi:hypothetical protein